MKCRRHELFLLPRGMFAEDWLHEMDWLESGYDLQGSAGGC